MGGLHRVHYRPAQRVLLPIDSHRFFVGNHKAFGIGLSVQSWAPRSATATAGRGIPGECSTSSPPLPHFPTTSWLLHQTNSRIMLCGWIFRTRVMVGQFFVG